MESQDHEKVYACTVITQWSATQISHTIAELRQQHISWFTKKLEEKTPMCPIEVGEIAWTTHASKDLRVKGRPGQFAKIQIIDTAVEGYVLRGDPFWVPRAHLEQGAEKGVKLTGVVPELSSLLGEFHGSGDTKFEKMATVLFKAQLDNIEPLMEALIQEQHIRWPAKSMDDGDSIYGTAHVVTGMTNAGTFNLFKDHAPSAHKMWQNLMHFEKDDVWPARPTIYSILASWKDDDGVKHWLRYIGQSGNLAGRIYGTGSHYKGIDGTTNEDYILPFHRYLRVKKNKYPSSFKWCCVPLAWWREGSVEDASSMLYAAEHLLVCMLKTWDDKVIHDIQDIASLAMRSHFYVAATVCFDLMKRCAIQVGWDYESINTEGGNYQTPGMEGGKMLEKRTVWWCHNVMEPDKATIRMKVFQRSPMRARWAPGGSKGSKVISVFPRASHALNLPGLLTVPADANLDIGDIVSCSVEITMKEPHPSAYSCLPPDACQTDHYLTERVAFFIEWMKDGKKFRRVLHPAQALMGSDKNDITSTNPKTMRQYSFVTKVLIWLLKIVYNETETVKLPEWHPGKLGKHGLIMDVAYNHMSQTLNATPAQFMRFPVPSERSMTEMLQALVMRGSEDLHFGPTPTRDQMVFIRDRYITGSINTKCDLCVASRWALFGFDYSVAAQVDGQIRKCIQEQDESGEWTCDLCKRLGRPCHYSKEDDFLGKHRALLWKQQNWDDGVVIGESDEYQVGAYGMVVTDNTDGSDDFVHREDSASNIVAPVASVESGSSQVTIRGRGVRTSRYRHGSARAPRGSRAAKKSEYTDENTGDGDEGEQSGEAVISSRGTTRGRRNATRGGRRPRNTIVDSLPPTAKKGKSKKKVEEYDDEDEEGIEEEVGSSPIRRETRSGRLSETAKGKEKESIDNAEDEEDKVVKRT